MTVLISEAVHNENGKYTGGVPGDQTGDEVRTRAWYSRPWNCVMRFRNPAMADRFAYAMEAAAKNSHIGYNQYQRNTCLYHARAVGYDPSRIAVNCETDCSALATLACIYAGIPEAALYQSGNSSTTGNLRARLAATGLFDVFTTPDYTGAPGKLRRGDILLYEGHHVAGVVQGASATAQADHAESFDESLKGQYEVTAGQLYMRKGAGKDKSVLATLREGDVVRCYGYNTRADGKRWLYVQSGSLTGFCSELYLKKL